VKVLILHQYFNTPATGGPLRSYYLSKALIDQGFEVVVITSHNESSYKTASIEGIQVHYLPITYDNRFGFYKRTYAFMRYAMRAIGIARKINDVAFCYAISVPITVGLPALWLNQFYGIRFIFEVGDLWPDAPIELGFVKNKVLRAFLYRMERTIYKNAHAIVALSTAIKKHIETKIQGKEIHVIPNMADTIFYHPEPKLDQVVVKFKAKNKFVVSYIGAVGFANGLDYYLECARASQKAGLPILFLLCGDGAFVDNLKTAASRLVLENLVFIPFQHRGGVREIMNVSDAVFISYRPFPILETGSPNKYFDGLAAGKLILINFGGWIREDIEHHQCGVYLDPRYPHEFVQKIQPFLEDNTFLQQHQLNARNLAELKYSRITLSRQFVGLFRN